MGLATVTQTVFVTTLVTAVTVVGSFLYKKWQNVKIPSNWEKVGNVKKLHIYPLKSGHRIELERAEVTDFGLKQTKEDEKVFQLKDRGLVVYGAKDNEFRTARTYPKMVFIDVSVHDENHLAIDAPTMRTLYVRIPNKKDNQVANIKLSRNEQIQGIDCGDEAASWFSRYIIERESGLRLAYNDASQRRDLIKTHEIILKYYKSLTNNATDSYSDLSSVSLLTHNTVNDLNKRISSNTAVTVERFRHNLIVDGPEIEPYDEENWEWIKVGENVVLRNVNTSRCAFASINQENGVDGADQEFIKTLETYRKQSGVEHPLPKFGVNLDVRKTGFIKVGDPIYVVRKQTKH